MVDNIGIFLDIDNKFKDIKSKVEIEVLELEHTVFGLIKYVFYDEKFIVVDYTPTEDYPELPYYWMEEI